LERSELIKKRAFPGRYESLAAIRDFVVQAAREVGFSEEDVYRVELSVDEACANIIEHAYGGEDKGDIQCWIAIEAEGIRIRLQDFGCPFDPSKVSQPRLKVPIEKVKTRGVGFFLMNKLMDEVRYSSSLRGGNVMEMYKRR
jgi:serine/threonine-protein kinase RsbW